MNRKFIFLSFLSFFFIYFLWFFVLHGAVETIPVYLAMIHDIIAVHYMVVDILHSFIYVTILTTLTVWSKLFTNLILNKENKPTRLCYHFILFWKEPQLAHKAKKNRRPSMGENLVCLFTVVDLLFTLCSWLASPWKRKRDRVRLISP